MTCDVSHLGVHEVRAMRYPAFPLQPQAHSSRALRAKPWWSCDPVTAASWAPSGPLRPTKKRCCKSVYCAEMKGTKPTNFVEQICLFGFSMQVEDFPNTVTLSDVQLRYLLLTIHIHPTSTIFLYIGVKGRWWIPESNKRPQERVRARLAHPS